jgi:hypothetical protein
VIGERIQDAAGHRWYRLEGGRLAPSVTTVCGVLPKLGLDAWREKHGAERAAELVQAAAERGTRLHVAFEALLLGRPLPDGLVGDEPEVVDRLREWIARRCPRDVESERFIVGDTPHGHYAGTLDLLCCTLDGERVVVDLKSGSGPWDSQHAQVASYAMAVQAPRGLLIFASTAGVREEPVDLVRGWAIFEAAHRLYTLLHEPPCEIRLVA